MSLKVVKFYLPVCYIFVQNYEIYCYYSVIIIHYYANVIACIHKGPSIGEV